MMDREWEQMKKEQRLTRQSLKDKGIPHIEVNVINDVQHESPLSHTAFAMESLINTLLAMYTTTGGAEFVSLLAYTTSNLENIHALTADMITDKLKSMHGDEGFNELLEQMRAFYDSVMEDHERASDVPDAFKDAFKDEESKDE